MKCSMRVGFAALLIAFIMALAGSAWADEASVVKAITEFGLARQAGQSGSTITIVNASANPLMKDVPSNPVPVPPPGSPYWLLLLNLEDITGITIDWKANLTVTGDLDWSDSNESGRNVGVVRFRNGTFNMTDGTIEIKTTGIIETTAIEAEGNSTVTVDGGTIRGTGALHSGIGADSGGKVIAKSGKVYFPRGAL